MPKDIIDLSDIKPGDIYEDTFYHQCLCVDIVDKTLIQGISLVDGSYPRGEEIGLALIRKLSPEEAWIWRTKGPQDLEDDDISKMGDSQKWWK